MDKIEALYSKTLPSSRAGSFYNTFPYPTKISPEAIAVYIACTTDPGDMVLDALPGVEVQALRLFCASIQPSVWRR